MELTELLLKAETLFQNVSLYLNNLIIALVIILFGFILGKIVESVLRKVFTHANLDERMAKIFHARRNYARAIRRTIVRLIYVATVVIALLRLRIFEQVFAVLLFLVIFVVLVSWVLAGIEVVPNIIARTTLLRKIAVGDEVTFLHSSGTIQGTVVDITLTDVRLKRRNGDVFFIPNAVFLKESILRKK